MTSLAVSSGAIADNGSWPSRAISRINRSAAITGSSAVSGKKKMRTIQKELSKKILKKERPDKIVKEVILLNGNPIDIRADIDKECVENIIRHNDGLGW